MNLYAHLVSQLCQLCFVLIHSLQVIFSFVFFNVGNAHLEIVIGSPGESFF